MIPRTFPSTFAANGQQQMVVYSLPSITGLTAWIDYIPVKGVTTESATLENTYANGGYQVVDSLASLTGKQAWLDYIPVYEDASYTKPWSTDAGGYIPTSALAALLLDFTSGRLDPRITFSRTTNATVTGSNGLIQYAPMNLLTFSEQFDNAAWSKNNGGFWNAVTVSANAQAAPNGTITAEQVTSSATASHGIVQSITCTPNTTYTFSAYVKDIDYGDNLTIMFFSTYGTPTSSVAVTLTNGWTRVSAQFTTGAAQTTLISGLGKNATVSSKSFLVWGAQLEVGSTATTYNPTTVKNLLGFTENFDNAAWAKSNASISATLVTDIYGQLFAQKLVEDTANNTHFVNQIAGSVGSVEVRTIYAKAAERTWLYLGIGATSFAYFNLASGATGTVNAGTASITAVGDGWFRCSLAATRATNLNNATAIASSNGGIFYTGDGTSGIYIFGAQLADSASVDPYVYQPVAAPTSTAYYGPRFDYDPVTLAPKGLLIEEQRTNLLTYSEQFDNAAWTKSATTVTSNSVVSPDGTVDADTLTSDGTATQHSVSASPTLAVTTAYAFSVYAKAGTTNFLQITTNLVAGSINHYANFNLQTGVVSAVGSSATATIQAVGNGWYRCTTVMTSVLTSSSATFILIPIDSGTAARNPSFSAVTSVYIWGAQLEVGAFATSYIPTVASQVTRAADSASMIGNNFARWYNQTAGTVYAAVRPIAQPASGKTARFLEINDGTANGRNPLFFGNNDAGTISTAAQYRVGGVIQASLTAATNPFLANALLTVASAYMQNDFAASFNGTSAITDSSGSVLSGAVELDIGYARSAPTEPLNGHISRIAYYNRRLSNTELQGITS